MQVTTDCNYHVKHRWKIQLSLFLLCPLYGALFFSEPCHRFFPSAPKIITPNQSYAITYLYLPIPTETATLPFNHLPLPFNHLLLPFSHPRSRPKKFSVPKNPPTRPYTPITDRPPKRALSEDGFYTPTREKKTKTPTYLISSPQKRHRNLIFLRLDIPVAVYTATNTTKETCPMSLLHTTSSSHHQGPTSPSLDMTILKLDLLPTLRRQSEDSDTAASQSEHAPLLRALPESHYVVPRSVSRERRLHHPRTSLEYPPRSLDLPVRNPRRCLVSILELHRSGRQQNMPFVQRLLSSGYTVLNPMSSSHDLSTFGFSDSCSVALGDVDYEDFDRPLRRMSVLNELRPEKLIGDWLPLADWKAGYVDPKTAKRLLREFYTHQNALIERFSEIDNLLDYGKIHLNMLNTYTDPKSGSLLPKLAEDPEYSLEPMKQSNLKSRFNAEPGNIREGGQFLGYDEELSSQSVLVAILVNFAVNTVLLIGKIVISLLTNSLSVIASLVDSVLDFLSTFIIYIANRLSNNKNWRTQIFYPIGRTKLEPLGILIFSVIIIISFFQVGLESFKKLFLSKPDERIVVEIGLEAIIIMLATIIAKIVCWAWCITSKSSSVQALAQDAMTDVVFNTVSLIMPTVGHYAGIWWADPLGALLLSVYIIISWGYTAFEHIDNLTGAASSTTDYKVILYLAYRFAECIKQITALKVYHVGDNLNVEIDLVFDTENYNLSFKDAHDIAEALQYAIESLPMVERAFVHIDYMEGNFKGHLT